MKSMNSADIELETSHHLRWAENRLMNIPVFFKV
jgi:hypothetical protein